MVDVQDHVIGHAEKMLAHQNELLHRAFSVMLYRKVSGELQFLLQKRAEHKYHCAGLWANTCCSHPRPHEKTKDSAERRLKEELGITVPLSNIGYFIYKVRFDNGLSEHEFDHVFIGEYLTTPTSFNTDEINALVWMNSKSLTQALISTPKKFTPWLSQVMFCCLKYLAA